MWLCNFIFRILYCYERVFMRNTAKESRIGNSYDVNGLTFDEWMVKVREVMTEGRMKYGVYSPLYGKKDRRSENT